jgi:NTP pyrophosphatase (non-canonical NTP hydrolase)
MILKNFKNFYSTYIEWFSTKNPKSLSDTALKLGEETGEVMEALSAFRGSKSKIKKLEKKGQTPRDAVLEELGDVVRVALNLATLCNIPHDELFLAASEKNGLRTAKIIEENENGSSTRRAG